MDNNKLQQQLDRAKAELDVIYEITNAMRTTLRLEEILYIILSAVTAKAGLGFDRAMLFLIDERKEIIEGQMGVGPDTLEEAGTKWKQIESEKKSLEDYLGESKTRKIFKPKINDIVKNISIPLSENKNIIALACQEGMMLNINKESKKHNVKDDKILQALGLGEEFVIVPLKAKDKVIGAIVADNYFTKEPIEKRDLHILIMFSNQAGLAIENSRLYEKKIIQTHTDSLSGLWNHGHFYFKLRRRLKTAKEEKKCVSILMIDIDNFKFYNDTLGHQAGDRAIRKISNILKAGARSEDIVCRYGGEEFAIILPWIDKNTALKIAERTRRKIEKTIFRHEEVLPTKRLTISIGVATFPDDSFADVDELTSKADSALYRAKKTGRNKVCAFEA